MVTYKIICDRPEFDIEVSKQEYDAIMHRFAHSGKLFARYMRPNGDVLLLDHVVYLEKVGEDPIVEVEPEVEEEKAPSEEESNDLEKRRKEALEEMIRRSNCKHPDEKKVLFKTETKQGTRYFTLCENCGGNRSRFIAADKLEDDDKDNAKEWVG